MKKKYINWEGWLKGWWVDIVKAITSAIIALGGTNALQAAGVTGIALDLKQAGAVCLSTFIITTAKYFNLKPTPDVIEELDDKPKPPTNQTTI